MWFQAKIQFEEKCNIFRKKDFSDILDFFIFQAKVLLKDYQYLFQSQYKFIYIGLKAPKKFSCLKKLLIRVQQN